MKTVKLDDYSILWEMIFCFAIVLHYYYYTP